MLPTRLAAWQALTVALLFFGYVAFYACRSDLSVATPMMIAELHSKGLTTSTATVRIGGIASLGLLVYAIGKFVIGGAPDVFGGRRTLLFSMTATALFTFAFTLGGTVPFFTLTWIVNRFCQSCAWTGVVKVASKWFSYTSYGAVMAILSLSFLVGDASARAGMGYLIGIGWSWRMLFYAAGGALGFVALLNFLFLRESRTDIGADPPEVNPLNVYSDEQASDPQGARQLLGPLLRNRLFWIVCFLSVCCTLIRESFNAWTPTYFHQFTGASAAQSARLSALFPLVGAASVLLAGWLSDRFRTGGRPLMMFIGLGIATAGLIALSSLKTGAGPLPTVFVTVVAFGLIGPYSYLAGAFAMDFGGQRGAAVSSGFIDGVGYIGGVLAGDTVARVSVAFGWRGVFLSLAVVAATSCVASAALYVAEKRTN